MKQLRDIPGWIPLEGRWQQEWEDRHMVPGAQVSSHSCSRLTTFTDDQPAQPSRQDAPDRSHSQGLNRSSTTSSNFGTLDKLQVSLRLTFPIYVTMILGPTCHWAVVRTEWETVSMHSPAPGTIHAMSTTGTGGTAVARVTS